jgi:hypothetical protein
MAFDYNADDPVAFEGAHRTRSGLEPSVVSFDPAIGVLGGVVQWCRQMLRNGSCQCVGSVSGDLSRIATKADRIGEQLRGGLQVSPLGREHGMTFPYWSTAR